MSDSKSSQVSMTRFNILFVLNNFVVWMVSTCPPTSNSSSPCNCSLVTVPNASITIGIIVTFKFHSFFLFPKKVNVLILLFTFFQFYSVVSGDSKIYTFASYLFFFLLIIKGLVFWPRLGDPCVIPQDSCWVVHIPFVRMANLKFLTQLTMYNLAHPVMSSMIHILC